MNRSEHIDGVAGLMITYMIYGHICCWISEIQQIPILPRLLFLFMPWFFFKSGMFFRRKPIKKIAIEGWKKLIVPYIVFSIVGQLVFAIMDSMSGKNDWMLFAKATIRIPVHQGAVAGNAPLWFLLTLFLVRIIYNILPNNKRVYWIMIALSGLLSFILYLIAFSDYFYIGNTLLGLFFYGLGHKFFKLQYKPAIVILSTSIFICLIIFVPTYVDFRSNTMGDGCYPAWLLASIAGLIMYNNLFKYLPKFVLQPFVFTGNHAMSYFVLHWIVMGIVQIVFRYVFHIEQPSILFASYAIFIATLCPIIEWSLKKTRMEWMMGK
jgi:hypothetical protein